MRGKIHTTRKLLCCLGLILSGLFFSYAQPTVLGTQLANGNYSAYDLADRGGVRFVRIQATSAGLSGTRSWEFARGTASNADYSTNWRPYSTVSAIALNTYINPSNTEASARYNTGFGGSKGSLPAITLSSYYTVNIGKNSTADNFMSVLSTTYNPKTLPRFPKTHPQ
ncbi:MAG: hypothetical protein CFE23_07180 [Flavobacterium sp. BFFFF1]|uniref:hypothetical protein n=1 Tax=Flavobacterium sp. BFFFF1 TaxID=2015557 RepID=UPI000BCEC37A|nr:hypothetical protein [Flavobacterium sp. BFFFF1]OYU80754.1 MAG: hypothetical protein CFE23_07180 [Flavobacterium sp. BFFFF1]